MRNEADLPFFFGPDGDLFGLYHAPASRPRLGVLMCPPLGQDLIRCHRLYRQLAQSLAARGVAVLRFDYHGTGDSAGESLAVDWRRCLRDTETAADELRLRAGTDRVVAFGARLGATVAMCAPAARFVEVVGWDAVLDGAAHVARLDHLQAALREDTGRFTRPRGHADVAGQWLGFDVSDRLRSQLSALRIDTPAVPTLFIESARSPSSAAATRVVALDHPTTWDDLGRLESAILSHPLIHAVTTHLEAAA
ncbi:alpha/beta hydrolase [Luteibacter sp. PPL552]